MNKLPEKPITKYVEEMIWVHRLHLPMCQNEMKLLKFTPSEPWLRAVIFFIGRWRGEERIEVISNRVGPLRIERVFRNWIS